MNFMNYKTDVRVNQIFVNWISIKSTFSLTIEVSPVFYSVPSELEFVW